MNQSDLQLDKTPLNFGKYRGLSPDEISETDPGYIVAISKTRKPAICSEWLLQSCKDEINSRTDDEEPELGDDE